MAVVWWASLVTGDELLAAARDGERRRELNLELQSSVLSGVGLWRELATSRTRLCTWWRGLGSRVC